MGMEVKGTGGAMRWSCRKRSIASFAACPSPVSCSHARICQRQSVRHSREDSRRGRLKRMSIPAPAHATGIRPPCSPQHNTCTANLLALNGASSAMRAADTCSACASSFHALGSMQSLRTARQ
eukprot:2216423-Rhodomonas_salina.2